MGQRRAALLTMILAGCATPPGWLGTVEGEGDTEGASEGSAESSSGLSGTSAASGDMSTWGETGAAGDTGGEPSCTEDELVAAPVRRMTSYQFDNAVTDLTGLQGVVELGVFETSFGAPFSASGIDDNIKAAYADAAADVASQADVEALTPCDVQTTQLGTVQATTCFDDFAGTFTHVAWRRAATDDEVATLEAALQSAPDFETGIRDVIAGVIGAEAFWVLEGSTAGQTMELSARDLATRLSMFAWNSLPDAELLALADSGDIADPQILQAQAERLLADLRGRRMLGQFYEQLLRTYTLDTVQKDAGVFPEFDANVADSLREALGHYVYDVLRQGDGTLDALMTAPWVFADATMAQVYADELGTVPGPGFSRVDTDPDRRVGLLGQFVFPAAHGGNSQVGFSARGVAILRLACTPAPPPPPDVMPIDPPQPEPDQSRLELWMSVIGADPACLGCHVLVDSPSFSFDHYDAVGRWTETFNGQPIDTIGSALPGGEEIVTAPQLAAQLAADAGFATCMVQHHLDFALRRDTTGLPCLLEQAQAAFDETGGNLDEAMLAIILSDTFRLTNIE